MTDGVQGLLVNTEEIEAKSESVHPECWQCLSVNRGMLRNAVAKKPPEEKSQKFYDLRFAATGWRWLEDTGRLKQCAGVRARARACRFLSTAEASLWLQGSQCRKICFRPVCLS